MNTTLEAPDKKAEERKERKYLKEVEASMENARNQKPVDSLTITIEWKRSRMWGRNPHAEGRVVYKDGYCATGTAKASGFGYCKTSTVIADLFNQFLAYKLQDPAIIKKKWKGQLPDKPRPYGINIPRQDQRTFTPYYAGGIGEGCYRSISEYIGGTWEHLASTKTCDVFRYTDKASNKQP